MATQGSFFDLGDTGLRPPPVPNTTPDPAAIRKELLGLLDRARAGTVAIAPWPADKARMWRTVFPQMANWLPPDERDQLRAEFAAEMQRLEDEQTLASFGYRLVTVAEFNAATDVPAGTTREIVRLLLAKHGGSHVAYDPNDDDTGWLIVGDRVELARETAEHLRQPDQSPATADSGKE